MDTYSFLRELADSWILLAMFGFFLAAIFWAFRPGSTDIYDAVSRIPLRDDAPLPEVKKCSNCKDCASSKRDKDTANV